jgi:hypothetical protein
MEKRKKENRRETKWTDNITHRYSSSLYAKALK